MYTVYFLRSRRSKKIYTGMTSRSIEVRLTEHNSGSSKWSAGHRPLELLYFEKYECKRDALAREVFFKSGFGRVVRNAILTKMIERKKSP